MKKLICILFLLAGVTAIAQQDALVFFTDKENVQASLDNPISILTQEALDRKALHNIIIDERDVPVTQAYIDMVKNAPGITVLAKSKWLNCVYVQGSLADIQDIITIPFVSSIEYMDKDLNFPAPYRNTDKWELENQTSRIVYNYGDAANQIEMIKGDYLHQQDFTGNGMVIAVLDSGFPDFQTNPAFSHIINEGRLLGTFDFVSRTTNVTGTGSHGALTTSNMAAFLENQYVGTAPEASYYLFRTEFAPDENPREEAWWVEALERADSLGVDVVNTSLGYQDYDNPNYDHSYEDLDGQTTLAARGANIAFEKGMLLITSAGNDGNGFGTVATPADAPGVFSIGAVDADGNYADFSSRGPTVDGRIKPDVMTQGLQAAAIDTGGNVNFYNGTSFSSPILAGAATCLWQSRPQTTNAQLMQLIRESASMFNNPTNEMGYGIPNFETAYLALQLLSVQDQLLKENFAVYPNPVSEILNISFPAQLQKATITIYNVLGLKVMYSQINTISNTIEVGHLAAGVYIANIEAAGVSNSFKIIKQ